MADGEQNQQPPRYWFPYWSGVPQPPPPSRTSRPPVRPQLSRRLSPPSPAAAPSSPRRPSPSPQHRHQPTTTTTAPRGATPPTPPQSQASRPSPSRTSPLAPIRAPAPPSNNSNAGGPAAPAPPAKPPAIPAVLLLPAAPEAAPRQKDVDVVLPPVKTVAQVQQPAAETKPHAGHGKAVDKEHKPPHHKEMKDEHKSKDKEKEKDHKEKKDETKSKDKEKEKDHKEKEKKHHAGEDGKHKEAKAEHGKLHSEIKAGVADMVHKANGAAASGSGHGQGHERGAATVITLAGENKGASMKVGCGKSKDGGEWHGRGHRLDGGSGSDGKKASGKAGMMTALINSNVQVINNSLLLQSSCNGGDPGVHLKLSAKSASKDKLKHAGGGDKAADAGKK